MSIFKANINFNDKISAKLIRPDSPKGDPHVKANDIHPCECTKKRKRYKET